MAVPFRIFGSGSRCGKLREKRSANWERVHVQNRTEAVGTPDCNLGNQARLRVTLVLTAMHRYGRTRDEAF
jgi:hypothetical protein